MDFLFFLFLISPVLAVKTGPEEDYYHAAVVEYCPHEGTDGNDTMMKNGAEYVRLIQKAAETVIRMVSKAARDNQIYVSISVLEEDLSTGEELKYNTNIVFDRKGFIVSRYRKFNLYSEALNTTKVPDIAIFETDFGVRFGVFICADIFHKEPALTLVYEKNIRDFIFPNWFFAELKLGLSVQTQFGWAYMTDSNLLSAGVNSLEQGSTGSGIFAGRKGPAINIINERNETRLLTAKIFKKGRIGKSEGLILEPLTPGVDSTHEIEAEDFQNYSTQLLTPEVKNDLLPGADHTKHLNKILKSTICQGSLCCEFYTDVTFTFKPLVNLNMSDISYIKNDSFFHYQYRFATFDGIISFPEAGSKGIQVCAIIPCLDHTLTSCWKKTGHAKPLIIHSQSYGDFFLHSTTFNEINIKSVTKEAPDFTFPNILVSSKSSSPKAFGSAPDVSKLNFIFDKLSANLNYSTDRLVYAGLYSRIISRDA